jgi:hypothetical protein
MIYQNIVNYSKYVHAIATSTDFKPEEVNVGSMLLTAKLVCYPLIIKTF